MERVFSREAHYLWAIPHIQSRGGPNSKVFANSNSRHRNLRVSLHFDWLSVRYLPTAAPDQSVIDHQTVSLMNSQSSFIRSLVGHARVFF